MSQIEYSQTLGQQEEMEYLLTAESFKKWLEKTIGIPVPIHALKHMEIGRELYLREHGLPLTSEIKGL